MLKISDLNLQRGERLLLEQAELRLAAGWKVGLTGANGSGKSSLFALIRGELAPDQGELSLPAGQVIAHVAQETPALHQAAIDYVMDGDQVLRETQQAIARAEQAGAHSELAQLHAHLDAIDGYTAPARAARLLHGLGFAEDVQAKPVESFSGGWRMRLNLARALMCRSDILLLDEPTNHLDLYAVIWLEQWLKSYGGMLLLISHDRDFLDAVVGHIVHIEARKLHLYSGNYSAFEQQRSAHLAQQQAAYEKQQQEIAHIQDFVRRFRAKASKAKQAQSRLKMLERMERIAPAHVDSPFHFSFPPLQRMPRPLLELEAASGGYDGRPVIGAVDLSLNPGDRLGLIGPNGAGKSTLIKLLAGSLTPLAGKRREGKGLRIGYFAQHQLEQLHDESSPLQHLQRLAPQAEELALRSFLGGFGFSGERADMPVAPFSGGEKARLVLALLVYAQPHLLLLDEPTNHLDLEMRHALNLALQQFEGAMLLVSHDRHFLRSVTDSLLLVDRGHVTPFDGDLDDYRQWLLARDEVEQAQDEEEHGPNRREQRRQAAAERARLQPLRRRLQKLENELERLNQRNAELEQRLTDPALYAEEAKAELQTLLRERAQVQQQLNETEEAWLEAGEALESA